MKYLYLLKIIISIAITPLLFNTLEIYDLTPKDTSKLQCKVFITLPKFMVTEIVMSNSEQFNHCYQKAGGYFNIKLIDRNNEGIVLDELMRQSNIPAKNLIPIGELLVPSYIISEESLLGIYTSNTYKLTSIKTCELLWSGTNLIFTGQKYIKGGIYLLIFGIIYLIAGLLLRPIKNLILKRRGKQEIKAMFKNAIYLIHEGKYFQGSQLLVKCAKNNESNNISRKATEILKKMEVINNEH